MKNISPREERPSRIHSAKKIFLFFPGQKGREEIEVRLLLPAWLVLVGKFKTVFSHWKNYTKVPDPLYKGNQIVLESENLPTLEPISS